LTKSEHQYQVNAEGFQFMIASIEGVDPRLHMTLRTQREDVPHGQERRSHFESKMTGVREDMVT
jgi:hypothetical protein